jgi:hypothetical protein
MEAPEVPRKEEDEPFYHEDRALFLSRDRSSRISETAWPLFRAMQNNIRSRRMHGLPNVKFIGLAPSNQSEDKRYFEEAVFRCYEMILWGDAYQMRNVATMDLSICAIANFVNMFAAYGGYLLDLEAALGVMIHDLKFRVDSEYPGSTIDRVRGIKSCAKYVIPLLKHLGCRYSGFNDAFRFFYPDGFSQLNSKIRKSIGVEQTLVDFRARKLVTSSRGPRSPSKAPKMLTYSEDVDNQYRIANNLTTLSWLKVKGAGNTQKKFPDELLHVLGELLGFNFDYPFTNSIVY